MSGTTEKPFYHTGLSVGEAGRYVFLPGDPGRVEAIAAHFEDAHEVAYHREYRTIAGTLEGARVAAMSTGIGGPSTAIGVEELVKAGADTFIRVGTCGGMQPSVLPGDIVIATGVVRAEGTSCEYMPIAFPAVPDFQVLKALDETGAKLGYPSHTGIVQCKDSFFGQHEPSRMPVADLLQYQWQAWIKGGCLASEMESAALFVISSVLGVRAGSVFLCAGNQRLPRAIGQRAIENPHAAIKVAVEAMKTLILLDRSAG